MSAEGAISIDHPHTPILIVGGGPVGMLLALILAHYEQPCVLVEKSKTTTRWPKMEHLQNRTTEILRKLGLIDEARNRMGEERGIEDWNIHFSFGWSKDGNGKDPKLLYQEASHRVLRNARI